MTITETLLNEIGNSVLEMAENLLGKREQYKFNGFRYCNNGNPPQVFGDTHNGYTVYIGNLAKTSEAEAIFQTSHESIHLLSPTTLENVSVLEEGLATYFSVFCLKVKGYNQIAFANLDHLEKNHPKYYCAYEKILQIENLFDSIKRIRNKYNEKKFSDLTGEELSTLTNSDILNQQFSSKFNK